MPAYCYIIAMLHQHVDYVETIYNSSVCVFVPFIFATSPSDQGETCHFAVYLEDQMRHGSSGCGVFPPWFAMPCYAHGLEASVVCYSVLCHGQV